MAPSVLSGAAGLCYHSPCQISRLFQAGLGPAGWRSEQSLSYTRSRSPCQVSLRAIVPACQEESCPLLLGAVPHHRTVPHYVNLTSLYAE